MVKRLRIASFWHFDQRKFQRQKTLCLLVFLLGGCTFYEVKPLPTKKEALSAHPYVQKTLNEGRVLTPESIASLTVLGNPDIQVFRAQKGVEKAQAFLAGLLPDPTLSGGKSFLMQPQPGLTEGYGISTTLPLQAFLKYPFQKKSAATQEKKILLDIAWYEWGQANQAEILAYQFYFMKKKKELLEKKYRATQNSLNLTQNSFDHFNSTVDQLTAEESLSLGIQQTYYQTARLLEKTRLAINKLLGISPYCIITINIDDKKGELFLNYEELLQKALFYRFDIHALKAAHQSSDANLHQEILAQFPLLNLSIVRGHDTTAINTIGLNAGLFLPLFNRNQGNIAVANATRDQVYAEYKARLNQVRYDIANAIARLKSLEAEKVSLQKKLPFLKKAAQQFFKSMEKGDKTFWDYQKLQSTVLQNELHLIDLEQNIIQTKINLQQTVGKKLW